MNLQPLFETQKKLIDRIGYNEPDRFEKTILALLVEVGECANEWRGFKYWSKNQEPRTKGDWIRHVGIDNHGRFIDVYKNPLLEEYVDGLHFVLQLGIEHGFHEDLPGLAIEPIKYRDITRQFIALFETEWEIYVSGDGAYYHGGLETYLSLGEMLGFTWEQIEQAYMDKNKVNHERQNNGY